MRVIPKVRWGILSTARINNTFISGMTDSDISILLAVASRDAARAAAYARAHGIERSHGSYESLLADPDIDAVYISLPNSLHLEWATRALEAGKHVLCEKPLSRNSAEVEAAFETAARADRVLMEALMYRHNPQTLLVQQLLSDGVLGRLRLVRANFSFPFSDESNARLRRSLDGGALMDMGCYCVNALRLFAGNARSVSATQITGGDGVDVALAAWLRFADDVLGTIETGFVLPARYSLELVGEEASLIVADPWFCRQPAVTVTRDGEVEHIPLEVSNSYHWQSANLSRAVLGQAEPLVSAAESIGQARTIEALYDSAAKGEVVSL